MFPIDFRRNAWLVTLRFDCLAGSVSAIEWSAPVWGSTPGRTCGLQVVLLHHVGPGSRWVAVFGRQVVQLNVRDNTFPLANDEELTILWDSGLYGLHESGNAAVSFT